MSLHETFEVKFRYSLYAKCETLLTYLRMLIFCLLTFRYMRLEIVAILRSSFDNLNCYSGKNKKGKEILLQLYPRHLSVMKSSVMKLSEVLRL